MAEMQKVTGQRHETTAEDYDDCISSRTWAARRQNVASALPTDCQGSLGRDPMRNNKQQQQQQQARQRQWILVSQQRKATLVVVVPHLAFTWTAIPPGLLMKKKSGVSCRTSPRTSTLSLLADSACL